MKARGNGKFMIVFIFFLMCAVLSIGIIDELSHLFSLLHLDKNIVDVSRFNQWVATSIMFLLPAFVCEKLYSLYPIQSFSLGKLPSLEVLGWAILLLFLFLPFVSLTEEWNAHLISSLPFERVKDWILRSEKSSEATISLLISGNSTWDYAMSFFILSFWAGVSEEILFRGFVFNRLKSLGRTFHFPVWAGAFVFSVIHLQFAGFIPRMLLGAFLGYLLLWSKSLWLPIAIHILNNGISILFRILLREKKIDPTWDSFRWSDHLLLVSLTLIIGIGIIFLINSRQLRQNLQES